MLLCLFVVCFFFVRSARGWDAIAATVTTIMADGKVGGSGQSSGSGSGSRNRHHLKKKNETLARFASAFEVRTLYALASSARNAPSCGARVRERDGERESVEMRTVMATRN